MANQTTATASKSMLRSWTHDNAKSTDSNAEKNNLNYPSRSIRQSSPSVSPTLDSSPIKMASKRNSSTCDKMAQPAPLTVGNPSPPPLDTEQNHQSEPVVKTSPTLLSSNTTTFDYLYEFSETRKVLEDFFKCPSKDEEKKIVDSFVESDTGSLVSYNLNHSVFSAFLFANIKKLFVITGEFE